jgi:1-phosphatidylinositol-3-phosphate 5-kinase
MLNDSIDFNSFIKIITLEYPNQDKCQYVNGVVFKKDVAHRRMLTTIDNPRILILGNYLGYVQDAEDNIVDLSAEIHQESSNMQIIMTKIQQVNPHIIFVEHEASRLALETLFKDQRTVVTNVDPKMMAMIARLSQTIICPSTNLIDKNFIVGSCLKFRVEHIAPIETKMDFMQPSADFQTLTGHTSLMFLEGC